MALAVHHLALWVQDVERIAGFYRELLGLVEDRRHHDARGLRSIWLGLQGCLLMVERAAPGESPPRGAGWHLLALAIQPGERDHWRARIQAAGAATGRETPYSLYGVDPEGNEFALSHWPVRADEQ